MSSTLCPKTVIVCGHSYHRRRAIGVVANEHLSLTGCGHNIDCIDFVFQLSSARLNDCIAIKTG